MLAAALMQGLLLAGRHAARAIYLGWPDLWNGHVSAFFLMAILFQALLGLAAILAMRRMLPRADAHLRWPPGPSYVGLAVVIGLAMGLIMLVADYWPALVAREPPNQSYSVTPLDTAGFLLGMAITGLAEETIFRGLLVGMLVVLVPGRIRVGPLDLPVAAYIVALLFGLAHYESFLVDPLHQALAAGLCLRLGPCLRLADGTFAQPAGADRRPRRRQLHRSCHRRGARRGVELSVISACRRSESARSRNWRCRSACRPRRSGRSSC